MQRKAQTFNKVVVIGHIDERLCRQFIGEDAKLVEHFCPNGHRMATMWQNIHPQWQVSITEQHIAAQAGVSAYYQFNLPQLNALSSASEALSELFPGLVLHSCAEVEVVAIKDVIAQLALEGNDHHLILAQPESNHQLLQALIDNDQLRCFSYLYLAHGSEPYYQHMVNVEQLVALCRAQGYLLKQQDTTDPDFPILTFGCDPLAQELTQTQQQLSKSIELTKQLEQQSLELTQQLDAVRQQHQATEELNTSLQAELSQQTEATQQLKKELAKQQELSKQQLAELTSELEQIKQQKAELAKQQEVTQKQATEHQQQAQQTQTELNKQLEQFKQQQNELTKQLDAEKQRVTDNQKQAEQQQAELSKQLKNAAQQNELLTQQTEAAQQLKKELTKQQEASKQQLTQLTSELELVKQQKAELAEQLQQEQSAHKTTNEKLSDVQSWFQSRKKQALELEEQLKIAQAELASLKSQQDTKSSIEALQSSMETLFQQQAQQLQQAANALGRHVSKTQIEQQNHLQHILNLQHSIEHGVPLLELDSWSMPVDTLNQLVKLLQQNNYDMIIEFGAGQSTLVMAKALINRTSLKNMAAESVAGHIRSVSSDVAQYHGDDLPARIISFEQNEQYLQQTAFKLAQQGLESLVELVLAPLVPVNYESEQSVEPLYYDCMDKLQALKSFLPASKARILVVVDGPYSPTKDPLARFPALPAVLAYFSAHQLDLLLDDSLREGEQQVLNQWQHLCEQRGLTMQLTEWASHKGAALVQINP